MREYFIELIKKARMASPTDKLQIEADLALVAKELLKSFGGTTGGQQQWRPLCHRQTDHDDYRSSSIFPSPRDHCLTDSQRSNALFQDWQRLPFYKDEVVEWIAKL
jgi:hypothetical protein